MPFTGTLPDKVKSVSGGTMIDALAFEAEVDGSVLGFPALGTITVKNPAQPVSWIGAAVGLGQLLGDAMEVTPIYPTEPAAPAAAVDAPEEDIAAVEAAPEVEAPAVETAPATGGKSDAATAGDSGDNGGGHARAPRGGRG